MHFPSSPIGFLLHDAARLMRRRFEQRAAALGFTRAQWQVLLHLSRNEGVHQAALADILEVEPISLVRILDKLQARGLVERRQDAGDRRCWRLHLTAAAHPSLAQLQDIGEDTRAEALRGVSDAERDALVGLLSRLKANLAEACARPPADEEGNHG